MRVQVGRWLTALLVLVALAGCAARKEGEPREQVRVTTVRVENRSFVPMVIYVVQQNGSRRRLGEVSGSSTQVFEIPRSIVFGATSLRFLADPIGGNRTPISHEIVVTAGDQLNLVIQN